MKPRMQVEFRVNLGTVVMTPKRDVSYIRASAKKWGGKGRASLLKAGYKSVDDFIEVVRGR